MLKRKISIGIEDYREMVDRNYYYVDKTLLIKELLDQWTKVFLITRPRRFGKTLGISMIQTFLKILVIKPERKLITVIILMKRRSWM